MRSEAGKNRNRFCALILVCLMISSLLLMPETVHASDSEGWYGKTISFTISKGETKWGGDLWCESYYQNYLYLEVKGDKPLTKMKCSTEYGDKRFTINLPNKSQWKHNTSKKSWSINVRLKSVHGFTSFGMTGNSNQKQKIVFRVIPKTSKTIQNLTLKCSGGHIKISWKAAKNFGAKVQIFRADSLKGKYKKIKTIEYSDNYVNSYTDKSVKIGKTYYYKARYYDEFSKTDFLKTKFCSAKGITVKTSTGNTAAVSKTMTKAYKNYVQKSAAYINSYAIVNLGNDNKPVLLTGKSRMAGSTKYYYSCDIYYYVNGKVQKLAHYESGRALSLYKKNGKYYLCGGTSSDKAFLYINNNKVYATMHMNSAEKSYTTQKKTFTISNVKYTSYMLSDGNYAAWNKKYTAVKTIEFSKP